MRDKDEEPDITGLLRAHRDGSREAFDRLVPLVYEHLVKIARGRVRHSSVDRASLDTLGLVHESWAQLAEEEGVSWQDRQHFFAISSLAMRRIVVDHSRVRNAKKRGDGTPPATLETRLLGVEGQADLALAIDRALDQLAAIDVRLASVVECRFFAGLTEQETSEAMGVSVRTVQRLWARARAWLQNCLR